MNTEKQRIAIAEALGWTQIESCTCCNGVNRGYSPTPGAHKKHLPDYLNDLNAMNAAETSLTDEQQFDYACWLDQKFASRSCEFSLLHATAAQRAEAFLKTLNIWKE